MTKEELQQKLDSGQTARYGCLAFYKFDGTYSYSTPDRNIGGHFRNFDKLWDDVSRYINPIPEEE